jgi:hypothetical protein
MRALAKLVAVTGLLGRQSREKPGQQANLTPGRGGLRVASADSSAFCISMVVAGWGATLEEFLE